MNIHSGTCHCTLPSIHHHHHHHHHISFMELGHLLTRSGLTYPEVSSKVYHDSFCQLGSSISLPWVIYFEVFYLHVVSSSSCIPVICPKFVLFLTPLQFVHLFCNLSKCILLIYRVLVQQMYTHLLIEVTVFTCLEFFSTILSRRSNNLSVYQI